MELDRVPLAVTDPSWDVGRHCGLCLTWREEERRGEKRVEDKQVPVWDEGSGRGIKNGGKRERERNSGTSAWLGARTSFTQRDSPVKSSMHSQVYPPSLLRHLPLFLQGPE
ncbi:hypothetical protein EYF80_019351 [Liparis tanakae]|uniref:Uncharacterized protein n=1 Tax=Liparis tanakae TaxID=230148 RepID=A0A4Z2HZN7_9TELE|nr:hypothetical protein EYF80_019351 [Liparis tanakae]